MKNNLLTVSQLNSYISALINFDETLSSVVVKGEISNFKHHSSGHLYFTLKDRNSKINCVMFKMATKSLRFQPKDGMCVIARGRVNVYEKTGSYQIYVEIMNPEGIGSLYERYLQLLENLKAEGYFNPLLKKKIPYLPKKIALITSPTGAVVKDMMTTIKRRCPNVSIVICPVSVQGESAAYSISNMIDYVNNNKLADVIIVGRGGGSIEELWSFNERVVAESIFYSDIPVISAVGHETDFTISDFVADIRAATPTAAAELSVPNIEDISYVCSNNYLSIKQALKRKLFQCETVLKTYENMREFKDPKMMTRQKASIISQYEKIMRDKLEQNLQSKKKATQHLEELLEGLSYTNVLKRGFCILTSEGKAVDVDEIKKDDIVSIVTSSRILDSKIINVRRNENEK